MLYDDTDDHDAIRADLAATYDEDMHAAVDDARSRPRWAKPCQQCGREVCRWWGQSDIQCTRCGAWYNAGGQRLRDDWWGNPSVTDPEIDDLEGYERQMLAREQGMTQGPHGPP